MVDTPTVFTTKEQLLSEVSLIIKGLMPDITEKAQVGIKESLERVFSKGLEAEQKVGKSALSDIVSEQTKALEALKKELKEAEEEIVSKKKDATTAFTDALKDWSKALGNKNLTSAFEMLPEFMKNLDTIIAAGKALKAKQDITINATKLIGALLGEAILVLTLVVMIMQLV